MKSTYLRGLAVLALLTLASAVGRAQAVYQSFSASGPGIRTDYYKSAFSTEWHFSPAAGTLTSALLILNVSATIAGAEPNIFSEPSDILLFHNLVTEVTFPGSSITTPTILIGDSFFPDEATLPPGGVIENSAILSHSLVYGFSGAALGLFTPGSGASMFVFSESASGVTYGGQGMFVRVNATLIYNVPDNASSFMLTALAIIVCALMHRLKGVRAFQH